MDCKLAGAQPVIQADEEVEKVGVEGGRESYSG